MGFHLPRHGVEVRALERARTRVRRREPDALDVREGLACGRMSVVERFDGGQRLYFVLENPPLALDHRSLSRRELDVIRLAAKGLPHRGAARSRR